MTPTPEEKRLAEEFYRRPAPENVAWASWVENELAILLASQRVKLLEGAREAVKEAFTPIEKVVPCAGLHCQCPNKTCLNRDTAYYGAIVAIEAFDSFAKQVGTDV